MLFKKSLNNPKGFSLIEVMVTIGLLSSLVMVFMNLTDRISETERNMMDMMEMNEIISRVRYQLNDSVACNKTLSVEKYKEGYRLPSELEKIVDRNGIAILSVGKNVGKIKVEKIQVILEQAPPSPMERVKMLNLNLMLKGNNKKSRPSPFKLTVPVIVDTFEDKTPEFIYCDSFANGIANDLTNVLMERMCESFQVRYIKQTGLCDFSNSYGIFQPKEETIRLIEKMLSQEIQGR